MIHLKYILVGGIKAALTFFAVYVLFHLTNLLGFWVVAIPVLIFIAWFIGWMHYNIER